MGGVDFLTDDISQSYKDIGGAIVEVNAAPGFRMHVAPSEGEPRDVSGKVMEMLFPHGHTNTDSNRSNHRYKRQNHHIAHAGTCGKIMRPYGWPDDYGRQFM